jgi:hypothetical protein
VSLFISRKGIISMKKSILIIFIVIASMAMTAPVVFALEFTSTSSTVLGSVVFSPSTNVTVSAKANDGSIVPPNVYCAASWHTSSLNSSSGKEFAAISDGGAANLSTGIMFTYLTAIMAGKPCTVATAWPAVGASPWQ